MAKKADFSKKILAGLAGKKAVKISDIKSEVTQGRSPETAYAVARSIKNLSEAGYIESFEGGQDDYLRLTKRGRIKEQSTRLESGNSLLNPAWDGKWRIILLDLPESRKQERESLRYLLKKAGFIRLKNSAWVSPFPFEFLFQNIKKDFGLSTELMIIVTDTLDPETERGLKALYAAS